MEKKGGLYNQTASKAEQIALCQFIRDGHLSSQIRKARKLYMIKAVRCARRRAVCFEDHARVEVCASGLWFAWRLQAQRPVQALLSRALEAGIAVRADENAGEGSACLLLASAGVPTGNFESAMMDLFHALADGIIYNRSKKYI